MNALIDHTILKPGTTLEDVKKICDEAKKHKFAAVCIPPCFVKQAKGMLQGSHVQLATVIGFPLGYSTKDTKVFEAEEAVNDGADEIDMVINVGEAKTGKFDNIKKEINAVKKAIGDHHLKVIVETCYLSDDELAKVSQTVNSSNADFIKTSTGFGPRGASFDDIKAFLKYAPKKQIKASGGIRDQKTAEMYAVMGVARIGTSSGIAIMEGKAAPAKEEAKKETPKKGADGQKKTKVIQKKRGGPVTKSVGKVAKRSLGKRIPRRRKM